jgi:hypothetical protein
MYSRRTYGGFQMNQDPIIQELRKIRKDIEEDCQKRGESYFDHLLKVQEQYKDRLVEDTTDFRELAEKIA